jgi:hypothetical protein
MFFQLVNPILQRSKLGKINYWFPGTLSCFRMFSNKIATSAATASRLEIASSEAVYQPCQKHLLLERPLSPNPDMVGVLRMLLLQQSLLNVRSVITKELVALGRNTRKGKRANRGKRPCSNVRRRAKRSRWGNPRR